MALPDVARLGLLATLVSAAACSGDDARAASSDVPAAVPYTFEFAADASAAEQQLIRDAVQSAHAFHLASFDRAIRRDTRVTGSTTDSNCANPDAAAFSGPRVVVICIANPAWTRHGPVTKQKIVQHELFHVWQFENGWIRKAERAGAAWIVEGAAELMAYRGVASTDLLPVATALGCQANAAAAYARRSPPGLPPLAALESQRIFQATNGPLYTHAMLGVHRLAGAEISRLRTYGDAIARGAGWKVAFERAFGTTPAAFYAGMPDYLAGLDVPASYECGV